MPSAFWHTVTRFDSSKIIPLPALRNALGMVLPLAVGVAAGNATGGLIACVGALNVAFSDGTDPYRYRARRMCAASVLVALAVFAGGWCGRSESLAVALIAACAFVCGMMVAVGPAAGDIGGITLVTLIVFSAHGMSAAAALQSGALALAGGLVQTAFALALWPLRRYQPERNALAAFYRELGREAGRHAEISEAPPGSAQSTEAQTALAGLGGDRSIDAERCLALLSQAERIRLVLLTLSRLRIRIAREPGGDAAAHTVERALELAGGRLESVAQSLQRGEWPLRPAAGPPLHHLAETLRGAAREASPDLPALLHDARCQLEALGGQLRTAEDLAGGGAADFLRREAERPGALRLTGAVASLRANLTLESAAMRHALRLAACVAIGEVVSLAAGWTRAYWSPMTIAIVLKPDFTATFSRGILRVAGTLVGLALATALFHLLAPPIALQVILLGIFAYLLRAFGPANYGLFVVVLTGLVVLLLAVTGLPPGPVIAARGLNTVAGGAIALLAYAVWPTWERTRLPEELARLFDAYRAYFETVRDSYLRPEERNGDPEERNGDRLDRVRLAARLARSNLEASVARFHSEPGVSFDRVTALDGILANSHRLVHAIMSLEGGLARSRPVPARDAFRVFAADVVRTLQLLSSALHGASTRAEDYPDLREDHTALLAAGEPKSERYELVNLEADRIANSLNTLHEEVLRWMA